MFRNLKLDLILDYKIKTKFMQLKRNLYQAYKLLHAHDFVCVFFTFTNGTYTSLLLE